MEIVDVLFGLVLVASGFYAGYWQGRRVELEALLFAQLRKLDDTFKELRS